MYFALLIVPAVFFFFFFSLSFLWGVDCVFYALRVRGEWGVVWSLIVAVLWDLSVYAVLEVCMAACAFLCVRSSRS